MNRVILPVPVATNHGEPFGRNSTLREPFEKSAALLLEPAGVGVVVPLVLTVGANQRAGRNQDFEGGVALSQRALQPRELRGSPDRFVGSVGQLVRAAIVAA